MRSKLKSFHYFAVAEILIAEGLAKIQHHHSIIGWTILLTGVTILTYFIFIKIS